MDWITINTSHSRECSYLMEMMKVMRRLRKMKRFGRGFVEFQHAAIVGCSHVVAAADSILKLLLAPVLE